MDEGGRWWSLEDELSAWARRLLATFWDHMQGATATGQCTAVCLPASDSTPVWFFYYHLDVRKLLAATSKDHFINTFTQLSGLLVILFQSD